MKQLQTTLTILLVVCTVMLPAPVILGQRQPKPYQDAGKLFVLNQIALAIAALEKLSEAIDWLEISTEIYPKDANLFGILGDLYQKSGRREQAIEAYKRAVAIDPNFEKAKSALKS
jgi:tetratricopeptide (TPR) repeat protein